MYAALSYQQHGLQFIYTVKAADKFMDAICCLDSSTALQLTMAACWARAASLELTGLHRKGSPLPAVPVYQKTVLDLSFLHLETALSVSTHTQAIAVLVNNT